MACELRIAAGGLGTVAPLLTLLRGAVLAEYVDHYNGHRPHRALGQAPPLGPAEPPVVLPAGRVVRRDRLGGLIHEYAQVA